VVQTEYNATFFHQNSVSAETRIRKSLKNFKRTN